MICNASPSMLDTIMMNYQEIEQWLKNYSIENYTIHDNLVVDVDDDVDLFSKNLKTLPFQFGKVMGYFNCSYTKIASLQHCPITVGRGFYCDNNQLTSLQYCPTTAGGGFNCSNNQLTSLRYCPTTVRGFFNCSNNQLTSLQYCPTTVEGGFNCSHNQLTSLQYCQQSVGGGFYCSDNPFIVTEKNESEWMEIIKNHKNVFLAIKEPTEALTSLYKMVWEV